MSTPERTSHTGLETHLLIQHAAPDQQTLAQSHSKRLLGLLLLFLCVAASVVQVEVVQLVQSNQSYDKPYFILWLAHSSFIFLVPLYLFYSYITNQRSLSHFWAEISTALHSLYADSPTATTRDLAIKLAISSLWYSIPYTLAAYFWYIALSMTTPARLTAAYNTAACFAYVFEIYMLGEVWRARKIFAVLLAVLGVAMMSLLASADPSAKLDTRAIAGDLCGLLSAASTGFIEVLYKKMFVPRTGASMVLANTITALIGFSTFAALWIPLLVLHVMDLEKFELPTRSQGLMIFINTVFGVVYNSSFMPTIALMGPVWAAVGIMLCIPAVALTDALVLDRPLTVPVLLGSASVMFAFWLLISDKHGETDLQSKYEALPEEDLSQQEDQFH